MNTAAASVPTAEETKLAPAIAASSARARSDGWLRSLHPAYFALVMATGILAISCKLVRLEPLPQILFAINVPAYIVLCALTVARAIRHPAPFWNDFRSHQRAPGFFTAVAATSVLGMQFALQAEAPTIALVLWGFTLALWLLLTYVILTALTVQPDKPDLATGINGGWLTAVVAMQSVVTLGAVVAPDAGWNEEALALVLVSLWLAGGMLYIWMISLIFYRYTFFRMSPNDLLPPYWINMGAMAISALAGALLIGYAGRSALLGSMLPFLKGFTLLYWATATWWIPMLVALGVWRYVLRRVPLTYDPLYWGAVFPLAMYTSATHRIGEVLELPFLLVIPRYFIAAALTAWLMTFLGLIVSLGVHARARRSTSQRERRPL